MPDSNDNSIDTTRQQPSQRLSDPNEGIFNKIKEQHKKEFQKKKEDALKKIQDAHKILNGFVEEYRKIEEDEQAMMEFTEQSKQLIS